MKARRRFVLKKTNDRAEQTGDDFAFLHENGLAFYTPSFLTCPRSHDLPADINVVRQLKTTNEHIDPMAKKAVSKAKATKKPAAKKAAPAKKKGK